MTKVVYVTVDYERVKKLMEQGCTNIEISKIIGCSQSAISKIRSGFVKGARTEDALIATFKKNLEKDVFVNSEGCWLLLNSIEGNGYAMRSFKGKHIKAHRASYLVYIGEIPDGIYVLHKCDVRNCVNPEHLFLGTQLDNMQDMWGKGRGPVNTVLTEELVRKLRKEYKPGDSWMELQKKYGINRGVIRPAILGITWKHVK